MARLKFNVEKWAVYIGTRPIIDEDAMKDAWRSQLRGMGFSGITEPRIEGAAIVGKMIRYPGVTFVTDDSVHTIIIDEEKFKAGKAAVPMEILDWATEIANLREAAKSCREEAARMEKEAHRLLLMVDQMRSESKEYNKKADVLVGMQKGDTA